VAAGAGWDAAAVLGEGVDYLCHSVHMPGLVNALLAGFESPHGAMPASTHRPESVRTDVA
jgi:hypothetical protein